MYHHVMSPKFHKSEFIIFCLTYCGHGRAVMLIVLFYLFVCVHSVVPNGELRIKGQSFAIFVAPASFSPPLPQSKSVSSFVKVVRPIVDPTGCNPIVSNSTKNIDFYLLVGRGGCSYQLKQSAAYSIGAKGVIIYNSLHGIYGGADYATESNYECDNGQGFVNNVFHPVYSDILDATMPTSCTSHKKCSSHKCVITNMTDPAMHAKVCCAWDLYLTMGYDFRNHSAESMSIPAVFIRMEDMALLKSIPDLAAGTMEVMLYQRPLDYQFVSIGLLYLMAVLTVVYGSSWVAHSERKQWQHSQHVTRVNSSSSSSSGGVGPSGTHRPVLGVEDGEHDASDQDTETRPLLQVAAQSEATHTSTRALRSGSNSGSDRGLNGILSTDASEAMNLDSSHAVLFVVCSSLFLVLLYLVDLRLVVTCLYLLLAAYAMTVVAVFPFYRAAMRDCLALCTDNRQCLSDKQSLENPLFVAAALCSLVIVVIWQWDKMSDLAWVLQDAMGICVCVLCLRLIVLPNLKVAAMLLSLAFAYDVFFVFISPLFFSSSVMQEVAEGTSEYNADPNYCEKYPNDATYCGHTALPMLLRAPLLLTHLQGDSILGLGDIVLPGLLAVWAARHDMRRYGRLHLTLFNSDGGFYPLAVITYCLGLLLADVAVYAFETGQPALLYIVPCMLGGILLRAYANDSLGDLWNDLPPPSGATQQHPVVTTESKAGQTRRVNSSSAGTGEARHNSPRLVVVATDSTRDYSYQHSGGSNNFSSSHKNSSKDGSYSGGGQNVDRTSDLHDIL